MRLAIAFAGVVVAVVAAGTLLGLLARPYSGTVRGSATTPTATAPVIAPSPTPLPRTWPDGLRAAHAGEPRLIACLDTNRDGVIDGDDGADLAGLSINLKPGACAQYGGQRDFYDGGPTDAARFNCGAARAPALVVSIASAGSDLLEPSEGESMGLLDITNALQSDASSVGIATEPLLTTPGVFGAVGPHMAMERWAAHEIARRLDALPCLRAVVIGHSHGGAGVTSVLAALDEDYGDRLYGVLIDRTTILYDYPAGAMPSRAPVFNVYQTNEGWHGEPIDRPNFINVDESPETAPVAPSDGGGGTGLVTHKTLDDAPVVQKLIVDAAMTWLTRDTAGAAP